MRVTTRNTLYRRPSVDEVRPFLRPYDPPQRYPRGVELYAEGSPSSSVFILTEGVLGMYRRSARNRNDLLALNTAGSIPGGVAAIMGAPYLLTARAITSCAAYRLTDEVFRGLVHSEPDFARFYQRLLACQVSDLVSRVSGLSTLSARERLEGFLEEIEEALPATEGRVVPLRDREIAQLLAITPPYLSRLVRKLAEEGRIRRVDGALHLSRDVVMAR